MAKKLSQKKEEGNQAFRVGKLQLAYDTYTEALAIDPLNVFTNSKLYCNRATVLSKVSAFYCAEVAYFNILQELITWIALMCIVYVM